MCCALRNSRAVGALGLTPGKHQSGESDHTGISGAGSDDAGDALRSGSFMLVRSTRWSSLKAWAMQVARRRGMKKVIVALARRLAVIMHRVWVDRTSSAGAGKRLQKHDNARSNPIGEHASSARGGRLSLAGRWMR